jgi:hypothetical protein
MRHSTKGQIGHHEVSKRLLNEGINITEPDIDNGTDLVAFREGEFIQVQVKTLIFNDKSKKTCTVAGNKEKTFKDKYDDMALIIVALDSNINYLYSIVFPPGEIPDIKSFSLSKRLKTKSKYLKYKNSFELLL